MKTISRLFISFYKKYVQNDTTNNITNDIVHKNLHGVCPICLDETVDPVNFCSNCEHSGTCKICMEKYIENKIKSTINGFFPTITCPHYHVGEQIELNDEWTSTLSSYLEERYHGKIKLMTTFMCGGCHRITNMMDSPHIIEPKNLLSKKSIFLKNLQLYDSGEITLDIFYNYVIKYYKGENRTFLCVLTNMKNQKRKISLYLHFLKNNPKITTYCCNTTHCFNCKTIGFHDDIKCSEIIISNDVVKCPSCSINLIKSDGCNTMTCLCGRSFDWNFYKSKNTKLELFEKQYPIETAKNCALLLTTNNHNSFEIAKTWYDENSDLVDPFLELLFVQKYPYYTEYCYFTLNDNDLSFGLLKGKNIWKKNNLQKIQQVERERDSISLKLFLTLTTQNNSDRLHSAFLIINENNYFTKNDKIQNNLIKKGASLWVNQNQEIFKQYVLSLGIDKFIQFLDKHTKNIKIIENIRFDFLNINLTDLLVFLTEDGYKYLCNSQNTTNNKKKIINDLFKNNKFETLCFEYSQIWNELVKQYDFSKIFNLFTKIKNIIASKRIPNINKTDFDLDSDIDLDLRLLFSASCWFHFNKNKIKQDLVQFFIDLHGDDINNNCCLAILIIHSENNQFTKNDIIYDASLAFIDTYKTQALEWCRQNEMSYDPLITNMRNKCQCVPRHSLFY